MNGTQTYYKQHYFIGKRCWRNSSGLGPTDTVLMYLMNSFLTVKSFETIFSFNVHIFKMGSVACSILCTSRSYYIK